MKQNFPGYGCCQSPLVCPPVAEWYQTLAHSMTPATTKTTTLCKFIEVLWANNKDPDQAVKPDQPFGTF